jgi:hypothetical protein
MLERMGKNKWGSIESPNNFEKIENPSQKKDL